MTHSNFPIEARKHIWIVLSNFYLDVELQASDFKHIASIIIESPFSFDEVKKINKYEVFPVLQPNLMSGAGEWAGFDEEWLVSSISDSVKNRTLIKKIALETFWVLLWWMQNDYWKKLKKEHEYQIAR